jgi:hypothetical protein
MGRVAGDMLMGLIDSQRSILPVAHWEERDSPKIEVESSNLSGRTMNPIAAPHRPTYNLPELSEVVTTLND